MFGKTRQNEVQHSTVIKPIGIFDIDGGRGEGRRREDFAVAWRPSSDNVETLKADHRLWQLFD
jgi:hypothetical protein